MYENRSVHFKQYNRPRVPYVWMGVMQYREVSLQGYCITTMVRQTGIQETEKLCVNDDLKKKKGGNREREKKTKVDRQAEERDPNTKINIVTAGIKTQTQK